MGSYRIYTGILQAELMRFSQEASGRAANEYREKLREEIVASGRVRTGEMARDIDLIPDPDPGAQQGRWKVEPQTEYFRYQDEGTRGSVAKPGGALRFKPKGATAYIFRKRTGPIQAAEYLIKVALRMRPNDWARRGPGGGS